MLNEVFAQVSPVDERAGQLLHIERLATAHDERGECASSRAQSLQDGTYRRHDESWSNIVAQTGRHAHALAHGFDTRAHPFEGQRLPCGEVQHLTFDERGEVIGQRP